MRIRGTLMLPSGPDAVRLADGSLRVLDGRIVEALEHDSASSPPAGQSDLGGEGFIITPGFIDAHLHLPQFDWIGQDGLPLLEWLRRVIFPGEMRWSDPAFAASMTRRVARRLLSVGTTGFAGYATAHAEGTRRAIDVLNEIGLRAIVGMVLMDQHAAPELCVAASTSLKQAEDLAHYTRGLRDRAAAKSAVGHTSDGAGRVEFSVNPRFAISCSNELLHGAGDLLARLNASRADHPAVVMQTHLGETIDECSLAAKLHPGHTDYTDIYAKAGLLTDRSLMAHGVWLSRNETAALRESRAVVAHCPTANTFLQSGMMPRSAHAHAGLRLALGSDIAGGPDASMVRVARAMIDTAKAVAGPAARRNAGSTGPIPAPTHAWRQITAGNADILGWHDSGRLAPDTHADVLIIKPDLPDGWRSSPDPLGMLLYGWDDRWLKTVVVAGRVAWRDGAAAK